MEMSSDGRPTVSTLVRRSGALYRVQLYSVQCSAAQYSTVQQSAISVAKQLDPDTSHGGRHGDLATGGE